MSKIHRVCEALDRSYGIKLWTRREPILGELVLTILSQNTTARNCNEAFRALSERFPMWDQVMNAPWQEIADAIRVGGLANRKAPRIKSILREIHNERGKLDLEWLADVPDDQALHYLLRFDGVGRKTAACVLMFALGRPVLPVDTHVHRVATRLGLIGSMSADAAHDALQAIVIHSSSGARVRARVRARVELAPDQRSEAERVYSFHINTVLHGRQVCHARNPECRRCCLSGDCDYFARQAGTG